MSFGSFDIGISGYYGTLFFLCIGLLNPKESIGDVDKRLVSANTRFGFKLFEEIVQQDVGKNIFISPSSAAFALTMTYNGAEGETREAMARTLELAGINLEEVNRASLQLKEMLENPDHRVELVIANSLWMRKGIEFKSEFIKRNRNFFKADARTLDFNDPSAPSTINEWVNKNTQGKIDKIVGRIDPFTILFLINAIYFKGMWSMEFDKEQTKEGEFTLFDGTQKKHPMMSQSGRFRYFEGENFQAVSLPYGKGRVSMVVFLPDTESNLVEFLKNLNDENWEKWMSQFREMNGTIVLPRLKMEYEIELNDPLKALGMEVAFDPAKADLWGMIEEAKKGIINEGVQPYISKVKQKTFVEVNEEGTEAAAVTSVEEGITSIGPTFNMVVDRPFFFAIRDSKTGTILFMGVIVEPVL